MIRTLFTSLCVFSLLVAALALPLQSPAAQTSESPDSLKHFDQTQKDEIEAIIRDYLLENPELLVEALNAYEEKRRLAELEQQREAISTNLEGLWRDPQSPVIGNPDGDVVLVEFFDYRCGYCKITAPRIQQLIESDPNLKVVMKEYPILSRESAEGAKAALAAAKQGRYEAFHFALMQQPGNLSERHLRAIAKRSGVDPDQMVEDMQSEEIQEALERTQNLARELRIGGTPALIIGEDIIPGAAGIEQMQEMIAKARANAS